MILGIGTDIASITRIEEALQKHKARFVDRCFSAEEKAHAAKAPQDKQAASYAKRWAAKEACAKALGLGIREDVFLKDISVTNDAQGKPALLLSGGAKERLTTLVPKGMTAKVHVSLSDDATLAQAFVVISAEPA